MGTRGVVLIARALAPAPRTLHARLGKLSLNTGRFQPRRSATMGSPHKLPAGSASVVTLPRTVRNRLNYSIGRSARCCAQIRRRPAKAIFNPR